MIKRKLIFALGILLFFGFIAINCSAQSSTNDQRIVGTWIFNGTDGTINFSFTYVFNANGTGTWTDTHPNANPKNGNFIYGISLNGVISIVEEDGRSFWLSDETIYFSPDGKTMILDRTIFRKK